MLTYESLLQQAKQRNMPLTKIRGIVREYLQILILKELYRTGKGKKLYFTGGTYLRLVHNTRRFSEDLDFYSDATTKHAFEETAQKIKIELNRLGIICILSFDHWGKCYVSRFVFSDIEKIYNATSPYSNKEGILIKLETNKPGWRIKTKTEMITGYGEFFPCLSTDISALFADKIDAFTKKNRGRHLYDIIYLLSNGYPIDSKVLQACNLKQNPLEYIEKRVHSITKNELKKQAESLRPFLFDEQEADLITNAKDIIPPLIEKYKKSAVER